MTTCTLAPYVALRHLLAHQLARRVARPARRLAGDQRGEGVISAAIAVLIMAFLGAAMWLAFKGMFTSTTARTNTQIEQIGG
jgi:hypothetical protein